MSQPISRVDFESILLKCVLKKRNSVYSCFKENQKGSLAEIVPVFCVHAMSTSRGR